MRGVILIAGLIAASAAIALSGCGDDDLAEPPATTTEPEPERPDPEPEPDRPQVGDGRGGVALERVGRFAEPVHVTQPPSGDPRHLYVVERCGVVRRVRIDGGGAEPFLDISDRVSCEGSEQGLLSIAFSPGYERSGRFYVDYTDTAGDTRVVEYRRAEDDPTAADPGSARELFAVDQPYANHNGGLVLFGPDRRLYVGLGDGGSANDPQRTAQDLSSLLGKILRIDPRPAGGDPYGIPDDNPHANEEGARPEIVAHGLRNPWRFAFDPETDDLWIGDVGQDRLEEVNAVPLEDLAGSGGGVDFGWSAFKGTEPLNTDQRAPDAREPVHEYPLEGGNCSVTGGNVVRDPELESLYGRYLYGDYCRGELRSFTARPGREAGDDRALGPEVASLSSFGADASGRLYATSLEGPVYRLVPAGGG